MAHQSTSTHRCAREPMHAGPRGLTGCPTASQFRPLSRCTSTGRRTGSRRTSRCPCGRQTTSPGGRVGEEEGKGGGKGWIEERQGAIVIGWLGACRIGGTTWPAHMSPGMTSVSYPSFLATGPEHRHLAHAFLAVAYAFGSSQLRNPSHRCTALSTANPSPEVLLLRAALTGCAWLPLMANNRTLGLPAAARYLLSGVISILLTCCSAARGRERRN